MLLASENLLDSSNLEIVAKSNISDDYLQRVVQTPEAFEKFFKKEMSDYNFHGKWKLDPATKTHRLTLPDGSYVRVKFFDTIKQIYNNKHIVQPGRESYLCYVEVVVMPKGVKGYSFTMLEKQNVWKFSEASAKVKHVEALKIISTMATDLGIDLAQTGAWDNYYAGKH